MDAVLVIGDGEPGRQVAQEADEHGKRVFTAALEPTSEAVQALKGRKVMAFAGIGRPEKFFDTLHACGAIAEVAGLRLRTHSPSRRRLDRGRSHLDR